MNDTITYIQFKNKLTKRKNQFTILLLPPPIFFLPIPPPPPPLPSILNHVNQATKVCSTYRVNSYRKG